MVTTRSRTSRRPVPALRIDKDCAYSPTLIAVPGTISGRYIPPEILMIVLDLLAFEDRANLATRLKIMKDLPYCSPAPSSITCPGWLNHRVANPAQNMLRLQRVISRCSSVLVYLNLLGTNILNQDLMSWLYHIDLPVLENIKFPNGNDLYICLLRDLAASPHKWKTLNQISIGFGSKLEISEECLELVRLMRHDRPALRSNLARCRQWLYYTDSRVKCLLCGQTICSQHFTRAAGNHCMLSLRIKCPYSGLKYHTACALGHSQRGCYTLDNNGNHWPCYKVASLVPYPVLPSSPNAHNSDPDAESD